MRTISRVKARLLKFRKEGQARNAFLKLDPQDPAIRELGESIAVRQLHPIWCDPEFFVITGHRRTLAGQLLDLEVDVCVTDEKLSLREIRLIQAGENHHRVDLTPYEKWLSFKELQELSPGLPQKDLAKELNLSESLLVRWLSPSRIIPAALEAFKAGAIGITDCYVLAKEGGNEQAQHELLAAKLGGATRDEVERQRQRKRNGTVQSPRVTRLRCLLSSGLSVTVSGTAVSLEDFIDALGEAQKQAKAALKDHQDAKSFERVMANRAKTG